jgi:hypothetical protein
MSGRRHLRRNTDHLRALADASQRLDNGQPITGGARCDPDVELF